MAKIIGKNLILSAQEAAFLGENTEYELIPNQKGMFLLIEKELLTTNPSILPRKTPTTPAQEDEKQQVIGIIRKSRLGDLVEGKFEAQLTEPQKKALLELVVQGNVYVFKLNDTYKKGVYRVKDDEQNPARAKKESESFTAVEKPLDLYTLEQDGFMVIRSKDKASHVSYEYQGQIKEGLLRGMKSFDGNYYLIQTDLLEAYIDKIIMAFTQTNTQTSEELANTIKASVLLTRIVCEFLKEEGELLEKKKGAYQYIK